MSHSLRGGLDPPHQPADGWLIRAVIRAQEGDRDAFTLLVQRYFTSIVRFLTRFLGTGGDAEDCAQDVFIRAWQKLVMLGQPASFQSWLYRIAYHMAYDHLRSRRVNPSVSFDETIYQDAEGEDEESFLAGQNDERLMVAGPEASLAEQDEALYQALARMSPRFRAAVILRVLEDLSSREIAEIMGIKKSSVDPYVSRGLEQLRHFYEDLQRNPGQGPAKGE